MPGEHLDSVLVQLFHLGSQGNLGSPASDGADGIAVQASALQVKCRGCPGILQISKVVLNLGEPDPPDTRY